MNYTDLLAKARNMGLSDRAVRSIVFDTLALNEAAADRLLADAQEITTMFKAAFGREDFYGYDTAAVCDDMIENRIPRKVVAESIINMMAECSPTIDTATKGPRTVANKLNDMASDQQSDRIYAARNTNHKGNA